MRYGSEVDATHAAPLPTRRASFRRVGLLLPFIGLVGAGWFILKPPTGDQVAQRFANFMRANPSLSCEFELTHNKSIKGTGTFRIRRPSHVSFSVQLPFAAYSWFQSPETGLEIEHTDRTYAEIGAIPNLVAPDSHISEAPDIAFPIALLVGDLKRFAMGQLDYKVVDQEQINGVKTTRLSGTSSGPVPQTVEAWIDDEGRMQKMRYAVESQAGASDTTWVFKNFSIATLKDSDFVAQIPLGYVQDSLLRETDPVRPGDKISNWKGNGLGLYDLLGDSSAVLVVMDPQSMVCAQAAPLVRKIMAKQPVVVVVFDSKSPIPGRYDKFNMFIDANGEARRALNSPGAPFFIAIDKDRKVKKTWLGYDPAEEDTMLKEILEQK